MQDRKEGNIYFLEILEGQTWVLTAEIARMERAESTEASIEVQLLSYDFMD